MFFWVLVCFFFFAILGFELRVLHLLGRYSSTSTTLSTLFVLVIFVIESCFYVEACLDFDPPSCASCVAEWQVNATMPFFSGWDRSLKKFLPGLPSNNETKAKFLKIKNIHRNFHIFFSSKEGLVHAATHSTPGITSRTIIRWSRKAGFGSIHRTIFQEVVFRNGPHP
jgi:hypothetical protein